MLIGPNGAGKTTLLKLIMGQLTPWAGEIRLGRGVKVGYMAQEQENLDPAATPLSLIRHVAPLDETDARSFLHYFLFGGDEVFTPIGRLSFGERSRLSLALLAVQGATSCCSTSRSTTSISRHGSASNRPSRASRARCWPSCTIATSSNGSRPAFWVMEGTTIRTA